MNSLRKYFGIFALCSFCIVFTACPGGDDPEPAPNPPAPINNNPSGIDTPSGGNGNNGSSNSTYSVSLDNSWPTLRQNGEYVHQVFLIFSVSKGTYAKGINEFGVGLRTADGTISNKNGTSNQNSGLYISTETISGIRMKCFTGFLFEDKSYSWGELVFIHSKSKTLTIEYAVRYYNSSSGYKNGDIKTVTYTPKQIAGD